MMGDFLIGSAVIYFAMKILSGFGIDVKSMLNALQSLSLSVFSAGCLIFSLLCLLISYRISVRIIENKRILDEKILRNLRMSRTTLRTFLHPLSASVKINI